MYLDNHLEIIEGCCGTKDKDVVKEVAECKEKKRRETARPATDEASASTSAGSASSASPFFCRLQSCHWMVDARRWPAFSSSAGDHGDRRFCRRGLSGTTTVSRKRRLRRSSLQGVSHREGHHTLHEMEHAGRHSRRRCAPHFHTSYDEPQFNLGSCYLWRGNEPGGYCGCGCFLEGLPLGFLGEGRAPTPRSWQALLTGTPVDTALYSVACTGCVTYTEPSDSGNSVRHDFGGELPRPANFITMDVILFVFHLPFLCPVYQRTNDLLTFSCICQSSVLLSPMADFLRLQGDNPPSSA